MVFHLSLVLLRPLALRCRCFGSTASLEIVPPLLPNHKRVYLLRHGETDWNEEGKMQGGGFDIELNATGLAQAHHVAFTLLHIPLDIMVSSHLSRASQTAGAIARSQEKAYRMIMDEFAEMRFGTFEGIPLHGKDQDEEMKKEFDRINELIYADLDYKWPGGESVCDVSKRTQRGLTELLAMPNVTQMGIVGHGRSNRILLATLIHDDPLQHRDIQQGNTCINVLDYSLEDEKWTVQLLNSTEHNATAMEKYRNLKV